MGNNLLEAENEDSSFISFLNELNSKPPEFGPGGNGLVMSENKSDASVPLKNDEMDPSKSSKVKNDFLETESKKNPFVSFLNGVERKCQTDPADPRQKIPRNEQNTPFLSSFLVELIHVLKSTLASIKNFSLLAIDKPDDLELQKYSHRIVSEDIEKIDSVLNSLLNYIDINMPIIKSNTLYIILQEVLEANEKQLQNKKIKVFKKWEKDLPETFLHDEQIRFILNSVLQYVILSTPFNGTIGFLTKSIDFQNGDPDKKISPERNGGYIELGIGFIGDKHLDDPSKDLPGISATQKEERLNLILEMVRETLQKNHGSLAYEVDPKKPRALITLRFPIERRKVVYYEPIAL